jgi:hypothetical protein
MTDDLFNLDQIDLTAILNPTSDLEDPPTLKVLNIHTSDRILFKRCRRKWSLQSPLMGNYVVDGEAPAPLWFGSGIHFALEDFHGYNVYGDPRVAFYAYVVATKKNHPSDIQDHIELGLGMMGYYKQWSKDFPYKTVWLENAEGKTVPMVEVNWLVDLDIEVEGHKAFYNGTWDRVVTDEQGRWWILDYKTAARYQPHKLPLDPQVTAYCWGAHKLYNVLPEGMIYMQLMKQLPGPPMELQDGSLSVNKNQGTSFKLYVKEVIKRYGTNSSQVPPKYLQFLAYLKERDAKEGDPFIRTDEVRRPSQQVSSEEWKIMSEANDMIKARFGELPLYPNPTRDCSWDCGFQGVCLAMDDEADWQHIIDESYVHRKEVKSWRDRLPNPQELQASMQERGLLRKVT